MKPDDLRAHQQQLSKQIGDGLNKIAIAIAEVAVEEAPHKPQMLPKEAQKQRIENELKNDFAIFKKRVENGAAELFKSIIELSFSQPQLISEEIGKELGKFMNFSTSLLHGKNGTNYANDIFQGKTIQEASQLSDQAYEALYQAAKHIYDQQHYEQAADAFAVLAFLNGKKPTIWLALGHSEYFCHRYDAALLAYSMAALMNPSDWTCHVHCCKCYEALHQMDLAVNALDLALSVIGDHKEHAESKKKVMQHRQALIQKPSK